MPQRLAQHLIARGLLPARVVDEALKRLARDGGSLDTVLLELGAVSEAGVLQAVSDVSGVRLVNLGDFEPNTEAGPLMPFKMSKQLNCVPLSLDGNALHVACAYPLQTAQLKDVGFLLGRKLELWVALECRVRDWQTTLYGQKLEPRFAKLLSQLDPNRPKPPPEPAPSVDTESLSSDVLERIAKGIVEEPVLLDRPKKKGADATPTKTSAKPAAAETKKPRPIIEVEPVPLGAEDEEHKTSVLDPTAYERFAKTKDGGPSPGVPLDEHESTRVLDVTGYSNFARELSAQQPAAATPPPPPPKISFPGGVLPPRRPSGEAAPSKRTDEPRWLQPAAPARLPSERVKPGAEKQAEAPATSPPPPARPAAPRPPTPAPEAPVAAADETDFSDINDVILPTPPPVVVPPEPPPSLPMPKRAEQKAPPPAPTPVMPIPAATPIVPVSRAPRASAPASPMRPMAEPLPPSGTPASPAMWGAPTGSSTASGVRMLTEAAKASPSGVRVLPEAVPPKSSTSGVRVMPDAQPLPRGSSTSGVRILPGAAPAKGAPPPPVEAAPISAPVPLGATPELGSAILPSPPGLAASNATEWSLAQARASLKESTQEREQLVNVILEYGRRTFEYVAAFAVMRGAAVGWDARGETDTSAIRQIAVPLDAASVFRTVALTRGSYVGPLPPDALSQHYLALLGRSPRTVFVWPVEVQSRLVAILYGDCGARPVSQRRLADFILFCQDLPPAFHDLILFRRQNPRAAQTLTATPESMPSELPAPPPMETVADEEWFNGLITLLTGPDPSERSMAMLELMKTPDASAQALARAFPGPTGWSRLPVVELPEPDELGPIPGALARLGQAGASAVAPLLDSQDSDTRYLALLTAGSLRYPDVVDGVLRGLFDFEPDISSAARAASTALKYLPHFQHRLPDLRQELASSDGLRRSLAARALGVLHDRTSIDGLINLAGSEDELCAQSAADALKEITRAGFGTDPAAWTGWWARAREKRRIEWLVEALAADDFDLRLSSIEELSRTFGDNFGFFADGPASERTQAMSRWQAVVASRQDLDL